MITRTLIFLSVLVTHVPTFAQAPEALKPSIYRLQPGPELGYKIQELLVKAVPGDVIEFGEGKFSLTRQIDIATDNITLRGQGPDRTILSFLGQSSGGQGIEATGNNLVIEQLAVEDTAGNAIKVIGSRNVTFRHVRTEWTGPAQSSNGAYGLYPVQCSNVLIDSCIAIGASDSGIYVGQSRDVIVRGCRAERNVAGIEIENTVNADVYDNLATNNTGGILVFDLPGLQLKAGRKVRLFHNQVLANNHRNFAAPGNIVALVPSGTGIMIMATDQVEVFENAIQNNQTASVAIISYLISGKKLDDSSYDPYCKSISLHNNQISGGGTHPDGQLGNLLAPVLGVPLPDILFDGAVNPQLLVDGKLPEANRISIVNNGQATFADFKLLALNPIAIAQGSYKADRDSTQYQIERASLPPVELSQHDSPSPSADKTVVAYRTAPKLLSEFGLFRGDGSEQQPADGVTPYDLNTTLFSDYTNKYRFIKLPAGKSIQFTADGVLEFPEGSIIAKTFAYPVDATDPSKGEQLLETRVELLRDGQWFGYSYAWNEQQTEAALLLGGGQRQVSWIHHDGKQITYDYEIPNANQCLNCHSKNKTYVPIGPTARNMNRDHVFAEGKVNQLSYLANKGCLVGLPTDAELERLPSAFEAESGTLDQRARAWLDVNCGHCHNPAGTARTSGLDLQYDQPEPVKFGVWKPPVAAGHGSGGHEYDIVPGEPEKSILLFRIESNDPSIRMPSVGRGLAPAEAVALIRDWISAMPGEGSQ